MQIPGIFNIPTSEIGDSLFFCLLLFQSETVV